LTVVSNSSVLIALSAIGQLELLHWLCGEDQLVIPTAVWREVVEEGEGQPGAREVRAAEWIRVEEARSHPLLHVLVAQLDRGEAEAVTVAQEVGADLLLLDEKEARRVATKLGIRLLGTVGLLLWAKREGQLAEIRGPLEALQKRAGFRISEELCKRVLGEAKEG